MDQPRWSQLIAAAQDILIQAQVPSPKVDARLLAEYVCGEKIALAPPPSTAEIRRYGQLIERRAQREPLQHLLGRMYFRYLELLSRPGVFIVRPETEITVDVALKFIDEFSENQVALSKTESTDTRDSGPETGYSPTSTVRVMDLCTGSGAIALAITSERPGTVVSARDLSPQAIMLACDNQEYLRASGQWPANSHPVDFQEGDATGEVSPEYERFGSYDLVVTNPPYIPNNAEPRDREVAQYDPPLALYGGGDDGIVIPQKILSYAHDLLRPGGVVVMEHGSTQHNQIAKAMETIGYVNITCALDLVRRPRVIAAFKG